MRSTYAWITGCGAFTATGASNGTRGHRHSFCTCKRVPNLKGTIANVTTYKRRALAPFAGRR
jgi:hypothetical protein